MERGWGCLPESEMHNARIPMQTTPRFLSRLSLLLLGLFLGGCTAGKPPSIALPYAMSAMGTAAAERPAAEITTVRDSREDRTLDSFLKEPPTRSVEQALAAELTAGGGFSKVSTHTEPPATILIEADLREMSWAVPNHQGMMKTAFWTSFLTGGLGGLAYGATDTPVFGHAVVALKITERGSGRILLEQSFDAMHEEKMAKLKCDSLETRARMMAQALKLVLVKATQAVAKIPPPAVGESAKSETGS